MEHVDKKLKRLAAKAKKKKAPAFWFLGEAQAVLVPAVYAPWEWDGEAQARVVANYLGGKP